MRLKKVLQPAMNSTAMLMVVFVTLPMCVVMSVSTLVIVFVFGSGFTCMILDVGMGLHRILIVVMLVGVFLIVFMRMPIFMHVYMD